MMMNNGSRWYDLGLSAADVSLISEFGRWRDSARIEALGPNIKKVPRVIVVASRGDD